MEVVAPRADIPPPWPHQAEATAWALDRPASYFDLDMGTGKSRAVIDVADQSNAKLMLVTTTKRGVVHVWPGQFRDWSRREVGIIPLGKGSVAKRIEIATRELRRAGHAPAAEKRRPGVEPRPVAVIVNWEMYRSKAFEVWAKLWAWDLLVGDEMHKVKGYSGVTSKAVARVWTRSKARKIGLSGTPMPHDPLDVFGQFRALDPYLLGTRFHPFRARIAVMGGYVHPQTGKPCTVVGWQNLDWLRGVLGRIMYQAEPGSIDLGLPPTRHLRVEVELEPKARKLYDAVEADLAVQVTTGEINPSNALVKLLRLQQLTSGIASSETIDDFGEATKHLETISTAKEEAVGEILEGTADRVVAFCMFKPELAMLRRVAEATAKPGTQPYAEVSGDEDSLDDWKSDEPGTPRVLGVQIGAGAEALDFTQAHHCAFVSTGFNMGNYLQALKRCDRPGQTRPVTFYHLLAKKTVDDRVYKTLLNRGDLVRSALEGLREAAAI